MRPESPTETLSSSLMDELVDEVQMELGHKSQRRAFSIYLHGLLSELERKSAEPIAAQADPEHPEAAHNRLLRFLGASPWEDWPVRVAATRFLLAQLKLSDSDVLGVVVDDTGLIKQGSDSVGVQRQYTGSAGKITNCQVAVTVAFFTANYAAPLDLSLYLPERWTEDPERRAAVGIPEETTFQTKPALALEVLRRAMMAGLPLGSVALADADYGKDPKFREGLRRLGLQYGVGVHRTQRIWDAEGIWTEPCTIEELVATLPEQDFRRTSWRVSSAGKKLSARFALRRVFVAEGDEEPGPTSREHWLVMEWRDGEERPAHFALCTFPKSWSKVRVIRMVKERWRIERMHQDLKGEVGFDHFEGRGWRGWQHHMSVVMCAYAVLVALRERAFPPCTDTDSDARSHARAA